MSPSGKVVSPSVSPSLEAVSPSGKAVSPSLEAVSPSGKAVSPSLEAELSVSLPSCPYHLYPAVKKSLYVHVVVGHSSVQCWTNNARKARTML